jgi:hypothetical protein
MSITWEENHDYTIEERPDKDISDGAYPTEAAAK